MILKSSYKKGNNFSFVKLGDVAKIEIGPEETRQIFRGNGEEMIGLGILKQTEANLIKVTNGVKNEFRKIKDELPQNIKIYESYDTSIFVSEALKEVIFTLCFAVLLVTIIIFIFLKNFRTLLIPFSYSTYFNLINIYILKFI